MAISLPDKINTLYSQEKDLQFVFKPVLYRLSMSEDKDAFLLLLDTPGLKITDSLFVQVKELMKFNHPTLKLNDQEQEIAAIEYLKPYKQEEYGVWVYYPWSNRLVHILDKEEFINLRTSRNNYKITPTEQKDLSHKKIGIVGLSVGQSVAVTMAMERTAGEFRLADFDLLEVTNLNRIRSGIHNLNLPKVITVAREMLEIDPFLIVKCFTDGLTENNMEAFFTEDGKLDLMVEESDGFDIKILSRYKAKALGIPVIMETSDRCMVDVERFDLEPDRSILHGFVDHLNVENLKNIKTTEDKIPYILDILGLETSSPRLKASMMEIDETINTWPQLASAVAMGGGITTDVSRRILLNTFTDSGRYYMDVEEAISNKNSHTQREYYAEDLDFPELSLSEMTSIAERSGIQSSYSPPTQELEQIVTAAIHAPSAGNNQPWKWLLKHHVLFLFHDQKQSVSWSDHKQLISNISFGAALENVTLQSEALGYKVNYSLYPITGERKLVAAVTFEKESVLHTSNTDYIPYLFTRHTNRKKGDLHALAPSSLSSIIQTGQKIEDIKVNIITNKAQIESISQIVAATEQVRFLIPQAHHDFFSKEIRWNEKGTEYIHEGLDIKTLEITASQKAGLRVASDPDVIELLNEWEKGSGFSKLSRETITTSSAIGMISAPAFTDEHWINGGRALERIWLECTKLNIALHPISAPLFLYAILKHGGQSTIPANKQAVIEQQFHLLSTLFPILKEREGIFLFRLSNCEKPSATSLKKSLADLYFKA